MGEEARRQGHAAIVAAVRSSPSLAADVLPAQLAQHAAQAIPHITAAEVLSLLVDAAQHATARMASEEACNHYTRALELVCDGDTEGRLAILLPLGTEQHRAGALPPARQTFEAALELARAASDAGTFARAALGLHALGDVLSEHRESIDLVDEAYARLRAAAPSDSALEARLLAAASQTRTHHLDEDRAYAEQLSAQSVELARAVGDDDTLGFCLLAHHDALWRPGTAAQRVELADEMRLVAHRMRSRQLIRSAV